MRVSALVFFFFPLNVFKVWIGYKGQHDSCDAILELLHQATAVHNFFLQSCFNNKKAASL